MQTAVRITAGLVVVAGVVNLILAPLLGSSVSADLWGVEPLAYVGAMLVIAGLVIVTLSYLISDVRRRNGASTQRTAPLDGTKSPSSTSSCSTTTWEGR